MALDRIPNHNFDGPETGPDDFGPFQLGSDPNSDPDPKLHTHA